MSKTGINIDPKSRIADAFNSFLSGKDKSDNAEQSAVAALLDAFEAGFADSRDEDVAAHRVYNFSQLAGCGALFLNRDAGDYAVLPDMRSNIKKAVLDIMTPAVRPVGKLETLGANGLRDTAKAKDAKPFMSRVFDLASMLAYMEAQGYRPVFDGTVFRVPTRAWEFGGQYTLAVQVKHDATKLLNNKSQWLMVKVTGSGDEETQKSVMARSSMRDLLSRWKKSNKSGQDKQNVTLSQGLDAVLRQLLLTEKYSPELSEQIEAVKARILQWEAQTKGELRQAS